jgi:transglutaminase-like putative cysteine protease
MTAAVAVLLTAIVLHSLFTNSLFLAVSAGAVIAVAATGALTRLRTLPVPVCAVAAVAGLVLYLNLVFEARHSWLFVIPTPGSVNRLWQLAGDGLHDANRYAPPAPNLPGLLLLAAAGVGITAVATDLIAVRLRSAALAGLPLLVLFTVPVMMNAPHSQVTTLLVFCVGGAGYLAMLSADGRERIRVWGHLVSLWRPGTRHDAEPGGAPGYDGATYRLTDDRGTAYGPASGAERTAGRVRGRGPGPDTRVLAAAGRRVGLASIVLALCAPLLIPGLHASKVFSSGPGIGGTGDGSAGAFTLPTAVSQTSALLHAHPLPVFTYKTNAPQSLQDNDPQYFRQYVLYSLGAQGWQVTGDYALNAVPSTSMPAAEGLTDLQGAQQVQTSVNVTKNFPNPGAQPTFLPLPYPATAIDAPGRWLADPELMVYSTASVIGGQAYSVSSLAVDPTQAQLEKVPRLVDTAELKGDVQLPPSYQTSALKKLAQAHVSGATTEFAKVDDLANWLSLPPYIYSLNSSTFDNAEGLLTFLTQSRVGYCVQYAYAMTVLTRLLGFPARFVVGYTAGTPVKGQAGAYVVKNTDAHAWTEVYFPTLGWIRFEPTPGGQGTASSPNYMGSAPSTGHLGSDPVIAGTGSNADLPANQSRNPFIKSRPDPGETGGAGTVSAKSAGTPWAAIALAVIAAIILACGVISMVAPPAHRALAAHAADGSRRRRPAASVVLVAAAAALVALALYRLLSSTSRLDLGAGWATVGIAFGAAVAVVLIAPSVIRVVLRRWRWMRATDDTSRAHAAWREFHDDLADFGVGSRPSEPPRTLAGRVTAALPEAAGDAVRRLALAEERASYAAHPAESANLRQDGAEARRGLSATAGRGGRWRARFFPASLLTALAYGAAGLPDRAGALLARRRSAHRSAG